MRRVAVAAMAVAAAASLWLGCTIWNDAELPAVAELPDASSSSSGGESGVTPSGCERAPIDAAVPPSTMGTGGNIDIVVAVEKITLGSTKGKIDRDFGYDLDGVCAPSCISKVDASALEGNLGRDDAMGVMLASLPLKQDPADYANESFKTGGIGILVRIEDYNGQAFDDDVLFSLYRTTMTEGGGAPNFADPEQAWMVDTTDLKFGSGNDFTSNTSGHGFVRNHQLVVSGLESSRIPFNGDSDILLKRVTFTADLEEDKAIGRWRVKNAIGVGRWASKDALETMAHVRDPNDDQKRLCQNPALLALAKQVVCSSMDLNVSSDNGANACNALSAAVKFDTAPARLGTKDTPVREEACEGIVIGDCN